MNREILRLAIPNIISNLSVPIVGAVDTALTGHLNSPAYLGAIGLGGIIFSYLYWSFGFLRMGTTGLAAQAYGRRERAEAMHILNRGLLVAGAGGLLLIALQWPIQQLSFWLLEGEQRVEQLAMQYFRIRIFAAPATLAIYAFTGWFMGLQNARFPMILTIGVNALNMLFSVYFVEFAGMKSNGVAMGTVLAQWLGLALALGLFLGHYRGYWRLRAWAPTVSLRALKSFFSVNRDIFLRTVGLLSIFAFFTAKSAELGTTILAANLLLMQLKTFAAYGIDGFAFATESLVGRFTGARSPKRLWLSLRLGFLWGGGIGLGLALVYWLGDVYILRIFSDQQPIIDLAVQYLPWLLAYVAVAAVAFLWDGVFVGLTASGAMRNSMIWALGLGFLPAFYIAPVWLGNDGLWLAMLLSIVARGLSQTLMAPRLLPPRPNRTAVPPRKAAAAGE